MGKKRGKFLRENEGENILKLFRSKPEWEPIEVPYNSIRGLGLVRQEDTLSIWVSGSCNNPLLAEVENAIAGIDVLVIETNPNINKKNHQVTHIIIFFKKLTITNILIFCMDHTKKEQ